MEDKKVYNNQKTSDQSNLSDDKLNDELNDNINKVKGTQEIDNEVIESNAKDAKDIKESDVQDHSEITKDIINELEKLSIQNSNLITERDDLCTSLSKAKEINKNYQSEIENARKRYEQELERNKKYAISSIVLELVDVWDNLYMALHHVSLIQNTDRNLNSILDGIKMTLTSMEHIMHKHGITRILPIDEYFDHNYHDAISYVVSDEDQENKILKVLRPGYMVHDRLLKPALVEVSKKKVMK